MKIGIFGGTFDPPHVGHLILAERIKEILELDKIIFVPALTPPHKRRVKIADAEHRLKMLKLSIKNKIYFEVSDIEIRRGGTSYTIDTLRYYKKIFPKSKIYLLMGLDNFIDFNSWKEYDKICNLCTITVIKRYFSGKENAIHKNIGIKNVKFIETPLIDISASEIRRRISLGKNIDYYVSFSVSKYIKKHNLYI